MGLTQTGNTSQASKVVCARELRFVFYTVITTPTTTTINGPNNRLLFRALCLVSAGSADSFALSLSLSSRCLRVGSSANLLVSQSKVYE